jgi:hypothetical protein
MIGGCSVSFALAKGDGQRPRRLSALGEWWTPYYRQRRQLVGFGPELLRPRERLPGG